MYFLLFAFLSLFIFLPFPIRCVILVGYKHFRNLNNERTFCSIQSKNDARRKQNEYTHVRGIKCDHHKFTNDTKRIVRNQCARCINTHTHTHVQTHRWLRVLTGTVVS